MKAIASGNPAVLTLAAADAELQRLGVLQRNHADEQFLARRNLKQLPDTIERLKERLAALTADMNTTTAHAHDRVTIGKRACSNEDTIGALKDTLDALPGRVHEMRRVPLGLYRGLRFGLVLHPQFSPEVFLEGKTNRQVADELYVTTKTVEFHISQILARLGIDSRTQIAAALDGTPPGHLKPGT